MNLHIGQRFEDKRGILTFNNDIDLSSIKRIYTVENASIDMVRGWQGHRIEQRWFACMKGAIEIFVIELDNFEKPSTNLPIVSYTLTDSELTYLHVPAGCVTAIKSKEKNSKLLVLADYKLGEVSDEYRFELTYFDEYK